MKPSQLYDEIPLRHRSRLPAWLLLLRAVFGSRKALPDLQSCRTVSDTPQLSLTRPTLEAIRHLSWRELELLVAEAFRRQGYRVEVRGGSGPDGGIDLILWGTNGQTIVQCKQWRAHQVGVSFVRELYGVMAAEQAPHGVLVTCGGFTQEAVRFAAGKTISLMDGTALLNMVRTMQVPVAGHPRRVSQCNGVKPRCPTCFGPMQVRQKRYGTGRGSSFWGCTMFPRCRGTRPC